jgi:hypothetical protein
MLTTFGRDAALGSIVSATTHIGLIASFTSLRAGTFTEASFTSYARIAAPTFGAAGDTTPAGARQRLSSAAAEFAANTGGSATVVGYFGANASSGGDITFAQPFSPKAPFVAIARPSAEDIYAPNAHGLVADDQVYLMAAAGLPMPAGLAENTIYHVISAGLTTNEFRLSTSQGGSAEDITSVGGFQVIPRASRTLDTGAILRFPVGTLAIAV